MDPSPDIQAAMSAGRLWRGQDEGGHHPACVSTGFEALDRILPGRGWPVGVLMEVDAAPLPHLGTELFLPAMAAGTAAERWAIWIAPPWTLHAPGLQAWGITPERVLVVDDPGTDAQGLWVMEQCLRCPACAIALCWVRDASRAALRRLRLAAAQGGGIGVLFRSRGHDRPSAAGIRLRVRPLRTGLSVEFTKIHGTLRRHRIRLDRSTPPAHPIDPAPK